MARYSASLFLSFPVSEMEIILVLSMEGYSGHFDMTNVKGLGQHLVILLLVMVELDHTLLMTSWPAGLIWWPLVTPVHFVPLMLVDA